MLGFNYQELCDLDTLHLELIPEKKGLFLKHVEYEVSSERHSCKVLRRYSDFVALYELLLIRFPYRIIPRLPPKKAMGANKEFIELRRKSLERFLTLVGRHPSIYDSQLLKFFLTYLGPDMQHKIREHYRNLPDEFVTSELASQAKELVPLDTQTQFAYSREMLHNVWKSVTKLKEIADRMVARSEGQAADMLEFGKELNSLANETSPTGIWATGNCDTWDHLKKGFKVAAVEFASLYEKWDQQAKREENGIVEKLNLFLDLLTAYKDLCERHEKGVLTDHQRALAKMGAMKKKKMAATVKGQDTAITEQLESKIVEQESEISKMENRNYFSLHCVHMETQLVHANMEILPNILSTMVSVQTRGHREMAQVWEQIRPSIENILPKNNRLKANTPQPNSPLQSPSETQKKFLF